MKSVIKNENIKMNYYLTVIIISANLDDNNKYYLFKAVRLGISTTDEDRKWNML